MDFLFRRRWLSTISQFQQCQVLASLEYNGRHRVLNLSSIFKHTGCFTSKLDLLAALKKPQ